MRERLALFLEEMDSKGASYGSPGDGTMSCSANVLTKAGGVIDDGEDRRVWLVLSGSVWVSGGGAGERTLLRSGDAVYWDAAEQWQVEVADEPLLYLDVDGPNLTPEHFAL